MQKIKRFHFQKHDIFRPIFFQENQILFLAAMAAN